MMMVMTSKQLFTPPPAVGEWSIVMCLCVSVSVCLSVCLPGSISLEGIIACILTSPNFLCTLPVAVVQLFLAELQ